MRSDAWGKDPYLCSLTVTPLLHGLISVSVQGAKWTPIVKQPVYSMCYRFSLFSSKSDSYRKLRIKTEIFGRHHCPCWVGNDEKLSAQALHRSGHKVRANCGVLTWNVLQKAKWITRSNSTWINPLYHCHKNGSVCVIAFKCIRIKTVPGSWKGTSTKFLMGLVLRFRVFSRIREAPSITCFRSSYMEPVTSNTKARVEALSPDPSSSSSRGTANSLCALIQSARTRHFNKTPVIFIQIHCICLAEWSWSHKNFKSRRKFSKRKREKSFRFQRYSNKSGTASSRQKRYFEHYACAETHQNPV